MIEKFIRRHTLAGRAIGCLLAAMVVNVFVGTAPASAQQWGYAWHNGKCYKTNAPWGIAINALQHNIMTWWLPAPISACRGVGVAVSKRSLAKKGLLPNNDRFPLGGGGGGRGQSNSQGNSFPGKTTR